MNGRHAIGGTAWRLFSATAAGWPRQTIGVWGFALALIDSRFWYTGIWRFLPKHEDCDSGNRGLFILLPGAPRFGLMLFVFIRGRAMVVWAITAGLVIRDYSFGHRSGILRNVGAWLDKPVLKHPCTGKPKIGAISLDPKQGFVTLPSTHQSSGSQQCAGLAPKSSYGRSAGIRTDKRAFPSGLNPRNCHPERMPVSPSCGSQPDR